MKLVVHIMIVGVMMLMASSFAAAQQKSSASQTVAFAVMRTVHIGSLSGTTETVKTTQQQSPIKMTIAFDGKIVETRVLHGMARADSRNVQANPAGKSKSLVTITD